MDASIKKNLIRVSIVLAIVGLAGVQIRSEFQTGLIGFLVERPQMLINALWASWLWLLLQYRTGVRDPTKTVIARLRETAVTNKLIGTNINEWKRVAQFRAKREVSDDLIFSRIVCGKIDALVKPLTYKVEYCFINPKDKKEIRFNENPITIDKKYARFRTLKSIVFAVFTDVDAGQYWGPLWIATIPVLVWLPIVAQWGSMFLISLTE